MTDVLFFPFSEYWWFHAGVTAFVLLLLALDLGVFHREAREVLALIAVSVVPSLLVPRQGGPRGQAAA